MIPTPWIFFSVAMASTPVPSKEELAQTWSTLAPVVATKAVFPIQLTPQDFETLAKGKVAKRRIREDGPDRAMGAIWTPLDRKLLWIAILDDIHDKLVSSLTETRLGPSAEGHKLLYQHLNLPWPIQDRQLVVEIQNNAQIAAATTDVLWERSWDLAEPNLMKESDPSAIWVPMATGSWVLFPVADGTVVVYHARSAIGGRIPDEVVTRWAMATLDEMMLHVAERAKEITEHYIGEHEILIGGNGSPISLF